MGERTVRIRKVKGSNPSISTIKETQFVYQGKLRFFAPFWRFSRFFGLFELKNGLQSSNAAVPESVFSVFRTKMPVYFLRFFALQRTPKKINEVGFEPFQVVKILKKH